MSDKDFIHYCYMFFNINIDKNILEKFEKYYELLTEWNKKFNLTTILEKKDVYLKHFFDSICLFHAVNLKEVNKLCDIGSGPGFPGIPLKIIFDNLDVTLVESNSKKCIFLNEVIKQLDLKNIRVINMRAEDFAHENLEAFDLVTTRAVANMRVISELSIPMIKIGGFFAPLKANVSEELNDANKTINILGGELLEIIEYRLPIEDSIRTIPLVQKKKSCDKLYPRQYSKIIKQSI